MGWRRLRRLKALMKKPGKAVVGGEATAAVKALLAAPRLREILEEQLKKLFDESDMQAFGVHKRTLQLPLKGEKQLKRLGCDCH